MQGGHDSHISGNLTVQSLILGQSSVDTGIVYITQGGVTGIIDVVSTGGFSVSNKAIISVFGTNFVTGVYNLVYYNGAIGGSGFAGLQLGLLPPGVGSAVLVNTPGIVQLNATVQTIQYWKEQDTASLTLSVFVFDNGINVSNTGHELS